MTSEQRFEVDGPSGAVPAIAWRPENTEEPVALVLAGHGGGGHKADEFVGALRDRLLPRGIAVAAIDAVGHGDRVEDTPSPEAVVAVIGDRASYDAMVADWTATLDVLLASGDFRADAVAYAGLSGGCLFGLPYAASDERIGAAALGACGYEGAPLLADAPSTFAPVLREAAQQYERPALFLLQADDDFFTPNGGRALFADLASREKRLITSPGTHTEVPVEALDQVADWLVDRLT
jgi:dienelactone hydrolase